MTKTNYTIALGFSVRQQKAVCKFNGFFFVRYCKGSHEIWQNAEGVQIVLSQHLKGTTFATIAREQKMRLIDDRGRKVY